MIQRILDRLYRLALAAKPGVAVGDGVRVMGRPIVVISPEASLRIGKSCVLISRSRDTALGVAHPCVMRAMRPGAEISIGDDCGLSGVSLVAVESIRIGEACLLGANVTVIDSDLHPVASAQRRHAASETVESAPVVIEGNVFIGANAIILKGVTIGRDAVVGAGSVVVSDVPAGSIAAGNPARVVGRVPQ